MNMRLCNGIGALIVGLAGMGHFSTATAAPLKSQVEMVITLEGKDWPVVFELDEVNAPKTCENFRKLCQQAYYAGTLFHRVIPGYIVQAGDPFSKEPDKKGMWGKGGPGYTIAPELGKPHLKGAIAMARLGDAVNPGKESSGSQFYVALDKIESLDGEYTVFGQVVSGFEVLERIGNAAADRSNIPLDRIVIKRTTVLGNAPAQPQMTQNSAPVQAPAPPPSAPEPKPMPVAPPVASQQIESPAPEPVAQNEAVRDITPPMTATPSNGAPAPQKADETQPLPAKKAKKKGGALSKLIKRFW